MPRWRRITGRRSCRPGPTSCVSEPSKAPSVRARWRTRRSRPLSCWSALDHRAAAQPAVLHPGGTERRHPRRGCPPERPRSRHLGASRQELFETLDRPAMQPLPPEPFVHADWRKATVALDHHVRLEGHHHSVPHDLIRQHLWARLGARNRVRHRSSRRRLHPTRLCCTGARWRPPGALRGPRAGAPAPGDCIRSCRHRSGAARRVADAGARQMSIQAMTWASACSGAVPLPVNACK